ncbi:hypothetical protein [Euzebyella saccharophila]|uniref:Uncharacterized protein n=1 Tax=Euzebyella saccharophila TaxID=679664 RepID=A0ABV8JRK6_9FLAO|nr:hypothetical protein [Euzebyella saccharophila]
MEGKAGLPAKEGVQRAFCPGKSGLGVGEVKKCRFQKSINQPSVFWFVFWAMQKMNI